VHDVIVVGAGPAGSAAASTLAGAGRDVLLIDRAVFPRDKPCGDGISRIAVAELERQGMWEAVNRAGFPSIVGIEYIAPSGNAVTVRFGPKAQRHNLIAPRIRFDAILKDHAVAAGARFRTMTALRPLFEGGRVTGVIAREDQDFVELRGAVVVAADGASSVLASTMRGGKYPEAVRCVAIRGYVSVPEAQECVIRGYFAPELLPGYAWAFPVDAHVINVGVGTTVVHYKEQGRALRDLLRDFLASPPFVSRFGAGLTLSETEGWPLNLACDNSPRVYPGLILVGDAGAFVNPSTGAGIGHALLTGRLAGEHIHAALSRGRDVDSALADFEALWRSALARRVNRAYHMGRFLTSRPVLLDRAISLAGGHSPLVRSLSRRLPALH
jgi:geranylgeranyl reductase family protein